MTDLPSPQAPDQSRSRVGTAVVAIALLIGWVVVAVNGQMRYIDQLAKRNVPAAAEQLVWLTRIVAFGFSLAVFAIGAWVLWLGLRTCRAGEFPPPGMNVFRSKNIRVGRQARTIGWVSQFLGLVILLLGTTVTWLFVELAQVLLRG